MILNSSLQFVLTTRQWKACQAEDWPVHKTLCRGSKDAPGQPSDVNERLVKWDRKWKSYIMSYAVALVIEGAALKQGRRVKALQWESLWKEYVCEVTVVGEEIKDVKKGKKMTFKFVSVCKKKVEDALGTARAHHYCLIISCRAWAVSCIYVVLLRGQLTPVCVTTVVHSIHESQVRTPELMGRVAEQRNLVLQNVPR